MNKQAIDNVLLRIIFILGLFTLFHIKSVFGQGTFVQVDQVPYVGTSINFDNDGNRIITLQQGVVLINDDTLVKLAPNYVWFNNEMGLENCVKGDDGYYYLHVSLRDTTQSIVRYIPSTHDLIPLIQVKYTEHNQSPPFSSNHRGGGLLVSGDSLYCAFGVGSKGIHAQEENELRGKIICLNLITEGVEIYASGLRNPFSMDFDEYIGGIWEADPGTEIKEEINYIDWYQNMGYPCYEGTVELDENLCFEEVEFPVYQYTQYPSRAVIGGAFYNDEYWWTDYYTGVGGRIDTLFNNTPQMTPKDITSMAVNPVTNQLYALTWSGKVYLWDDITATEEPPKDYPNGGRFSGYIDMLGRRYATPIPGVILFDCQTGKRVFILDE